MISPHTPPGTLIVFNPPPGLPLIGPAPVPRIGYPYTLIGIEPALFDPRVFYLQVAEIDSGDFGYNLEAFDIATMPKCLTDTLTRTKQDA